MMELGIVGAGRMGSNMAKRLLRFGHSPIVFDLNTQAVADLANAGARAAQSLAQLVEMASAPRSVWVMLPAGRPTHDTLEQLLSMLSAGDILIDGGNSPYEESAAYAQRALERGIHFLDIGTSGGIWGLEEGYCLMVGGEREAFEHVEPLLHSLAPPKGYAYVGPSGAGHFLKMVHNGIEYGMLESLAEGFNLLERSGYELDYASIASLWQHGSVIRCWLLDLALDAFSKDPRLESLEPYVDDSGEGRWSVESAIKNAVPLPAITAALFARFSSRANNSFADRFIAALRNEFGGHAVHKRR